MVANKEASTSKNIDYLKDLNYYRELMTSYTKNPSDFCLTGAICPNVEAPVVDAL